MADIALQILPVLLIIALGYVVRWTGLIDDTQRTGIDRVTYYVLFPCLIALNLATTDFSAIPAVSTGLTLVASLIAMAVLTLALRLPLARAGIHGPAFTSIFQGTTRWNTLIALSVAGSIYGREGIALVSVVIVAIVPLVNMICVTVLAHYAAPTPPSLKGVLREVFRNPFILACAVGLLFNAAGVLPPAPVTAAIDTLARAAVALGLIAVGAGLHLAALLQPSLAVNIAALLKLAVMPLFGAIFAVLFGVDGMALGVVIVSLSVPTGTNTYLLAREMGGDAPLMARIITFQTTLAMLTMPVMLLLLGG